MCSHDCYFILKGWLWGRVLVINLFWAPFVPDLRRRAIDGIRFHLFLLSRTGAFSSTRSSKSTHHPYCAGIFGDLPPVDRGGWVEIPRRGHRVVPTECINIFILFVCIRLSKVWHEFTIIHSFTNKDTHTRLCPSPSVPRRKEPDCSVFIKSFPFSVIISRYKYWLWSLPQHLCC